MTQELEPRAVSIKDQAAGLTITTHEQYLLAAELGLGIKALRDEAETKFRPVIQATHKAHQEALAALRKIDEPLAQAQRIIGAKITAWDLEQDRLRKEQEAEQRRQAAEHLEREAQQAALDAIEEGATEEEVDAIIQAPVTAPVVVIPSAPRAAGVTKPTDHWSAEVYDLPALVKAVASGPTPILAVEPNMTFLNQQARSMKTLMNYPGVRAVNNPSTNFRTGRK